MFSQRLKELRNRIGLSQKELAGLLRVSQQSVAKWETDKSTPNPAMLAQIAEIMGVSADYLLGSSDDLHAVPQSFLVAADMPAGYDQLTEDEKKEIEEIIAIYNKRRRP